MTCVFAAVLGKQEGRSRREISVCFLFSFLFGRFVFCNWSRSIPPGPRREGGRASSSSRHHVMSRTIVIYLVLAVLFALLLLWLLVRFLSCCCSPIEAAFCQLTWLPW